MNSEIIPNSNDEIAQVAISAARLHDDMVGIVERINQSVYKLPPSAEEMAHIIEQSSQSMGQQRCETEQVATAMKQMSITVYEAIQAISKLV